MFFHSQRPLFVCSANFPNCRCYRACDEAVNVQNDIIFDPGCPFTHTQPYANSANQNPCNICNGEFTTTDRALSNSCSNSIVTHCKLYYKEDTNACLDFPELVIGGDCNYDKIPKVGIDALEQGITQGRNGKGTVFVFASGNAFKKGDDVNFSGWINSRYTISVGAVDKQGLHADFSTPGAALLVSAPSGGARDVGHILTAGVGVETCADSGQGTSFSTPVVSGVIALMLEARPSLTWRDVQGILAQTSKSVPNDTEDLTKTTNGAGFWHSEWYGFGIIDAKAAVEAAIDWNLFTTELQAIGSSPIENAVLSDSNGNEFISTIQLDPTGDQYPENFIAESTVVLLDLSHYNRGDLEIELTSPSGTSSTLHPGKRPENNQINSNERWKLMTVRNWGESPTGNWQLRVRDLVDREGSTNNNVFRGWQIIVYGRDMSGVPTNEPTKAPTNVPTNVPTPNPTQSSVTNPGQNPTSIPTRNPTRNPTGNPTKSPVQNPNQNPTSIPTPNPTMNPTSNPTRKPTPSPTAKPTMGPTNSPTNQPTSSPTKAPTSKPTFAPTLVPTSRPTSTPSSSPTFQPSTAPSSTPTVTRNLDCENAILMQNFTVVEGKLHAFPQDEVEGNCLSGLETIGGWYHVIGNGKVFSLKACTFDIAKNIGISVFTGECDRLECIEHHSRQAADCASGHGQIVSFVSKPETLYSIFVSGLPVGVEISNQNVVSIGVPVDSFSVRRHLTPILELDYDLELTEAETPTNDRCRSAIPATIGAPIDGSTTGLLTTYKTCQDTDKPGAWYTIEGGTPAEDGIILYEANTCSPNSNFYNTISVFRGEGCGWHDCVDVEILPCPNESFGQQVFWSTALQEDFQIFVHSADTIEAARYDAGSFQMNVIYNNRLPNDQCTTAMKVELDALDVVNGTTSGARPDTNSIENSSCEAGGAGAWYRVTGNGSIFQASTCSSETNHGTRIHVYTGACRRLTCVSSGSGNMAMCDDSNGSVVNFKTKVGEEYYILVSSRNGEIGNFGLQVSETQSPSNNECKNFISLMEDDLVGSTNQATMDFPVDYSCGLPLNSPGVWYEVDGEGLGVEVNVCDSDFDSAISIFEGSACGELKCITGTSAISEKCANGKGVTASFFGVQNTTYRVYVHGRSRSSHNTGNFTVSKSSFGVIESNEFCPSASQLPTDGSRIQVSTKDATHASIPSSSCGVGISNPGLWYAFQGTGQPFKISACNRDEGDVDVSVSLFVGGSEGCDALKCLTGTTFIDAVCPASEERRFLQTGLSLSLSPLRIMTEKNQNYYAFVHGTGGVGDFDLSVVEENDNVFVGTDPPTEASLTYGKDLHRWVPINSDSLVIYMDYLSLEIVDQPLGNVTTQGFRIFYAPPYNYIGDDVMTVDGCNGEDCDRFDVTISVIDHTEETTSDDNKQDNSWKWYLWFLVLGVIPLGWLFRHRLSQCLFRDKKNNMESDVDSLEGDVDSRDSFGEEKMYNPREEGTMLKNHRNTTFSTQWSSSDSYEESDSYSDSSSSGGFSYESSSDSSEELQYC